MMEVRMDGLKVSEVIEALSQGKLPEGTVSVGLLDENRLPVVYALRKGKWEQVIYPEQSPEEVKDDG